MASSIHNPVNPEYKPYLFTRANEKQLSPQEEYCKSALIEFKEFIKSRDIQTDKILSEEDIFTATPLGSGITGAQIMTIKGEKHVVKRQVFSREFKENYQYIQLKGQKIKNRDISQSDDSYAHFPRKEIVGHKIATLFGLKSPKTELVKSGDGYASIQEFLPEEKAIVYIKNSSIPSYSIDVNSLILTNLFGIATENIDMHSGNLLLLKIKDENITDLSDENDEFTPDYEAVPIDYGLIFPNTESIFPLWFSFFKKSTYHMIKDKSFDFYKIISDLCVDERIINSFELKKIMTDSEWNLLSTNLTIFKDISNRVKGKKISLEEFFKKFLEGKSL